MFPGSSVLVRIQAGIGPRTLSIDNYIEFRITVECRGTTTAVANVHYFTDITTASTRIKNNFIQLISISIGKDRFNQTEKKDSFVMNLLYGTLVIHQLRAFQLVLCLFSLTVPIYTYIYILTCMYVCMYVHQSELLALDL